MGYRGQSETGNGDVEKMQRITVDRLEMTKVLQIRDPSSQVPGRTRGSPSETNGAAGPASCDSNGSGSASSSSMQLGDSDTCPALGPPGVGVTVWEFCYNFWRHGVAPQVAKKVRFGERRPTLQYNVFSTTIFVRKIFF